MVIVDDTNLKERLQFADVLRHACFLDSTDLLSCRMQASFVNDMPQVFNLMMEKKALLSVQPQA